MRRAIYLLARVVVWIFSHITWMVGYDGRFSIWFQKVGAKREMKKVDVYFDM